MMYKYILVYTWSSFVCTVPRQSAILRTQIALEEELGTCKPTFFQLDIMMSIHWYIQVHTCYMYIHICTLPSAHRMCILASKLVYHLRYVAKTCMMHPQPSVLPPRISLSMGGALSDARHILCIY